MRIAFMYTIAGAWIEPAPRANPEGYLDLGWIVCRGRITVRHSVWSRTLFSYRRVSNPVGPYREIISRGYTRDHAEILLERRAGFEGWIRIGLNLFMQPEGTVYPMGEQFSCELPLADPETEDLLEAYHKVLSVDLRTVLAELEDHENLEILARRQRAVGFKFWSDLKQAHAAGMTS